MPTPFISDDYGIELSAFARYVESTNAGQVAPDCTAWEADPRDAIVLGDVCRHMRGYMAHARAFYAWALDYLEDHPEAARDNLDLAERYCVLGNLCRELSEPRAAMEAWAKSIDNGSEDPVPYLRLACGLASSGREQEARARIDGLFALPPARLQGRLDPEQQRLAERLRSTLPMADRVRDGQDLRGRVRDLLLAAEQGFGGLSGRAELRTQALR